MMRRLALSFDPHVWVNVHSGMEVSCSKVRHEMEYHSPATEFPLFVSIGCR